MREFLSDPIRNTADAIGGAEDAIRQRVLDNVSSQNGPYNYDQPELPGPPVKDWLIPIGDTGIYITPNEPVDPWDCERWPDSPYCSPSGLEQTFRPPQTVEITRNECETCITTTSSTPFITGPPFTVCYRSKKEACQIQLPQEEPSSEPNGVGLPPIRTRHRCGNSLFVWTLFGADIDAYNQYEIQNYEEQRQDAIQDVADGFRGATGWDTQYTVGTVNRAVGMRLLRVLDNGQSSYYIRAETEYPTNASTGQRRTPWTEEDYPLMVIHYWTHYTYAGDPDNVQTFYPAAFHQMLEAPFPPCPEGPSRPSAPPQFTPTDTPKEEDPPVECNCAEMEEMLQCIYKTVGCEQFPVSLPDTLIETGSNAQTERQDIPAMMGWLIEQIDAVTGQFPIEIEVEDTDPTTEGNQTQKVSLPNIAETMAELYGLALKGGISADLHTDILLRMVAEVIATKNSTLVTQDYAKANASFLGYRGNPKKRTINYAFDPANLGDLTKVLKPSEKDIVGFTEDDPETAVGFLQRIVFVSGLLKEIFFRNKDRMPDLIDQIEQFTGGESGDDSAWEGYLENLNSPNSLQNLYRPTPNAVNIDTGEES